MGRVLSNKLFQFGLKITITVFILGWLIKSDRLDLKSIQFIWTNPKILTLSMAVWFIGGLTLCSYRWISLIEALGLRLNLMVGMRLTAIGLLFNTVMPGAVGGDLVKALYVCKGQNRETKTAVLYSIFLDRVLGLFALLTIGTLGAVAGWKSIQNNVGLVSIAAFVISSCLGGFTIAITALFLAKRRKSIPTLVSLETWLKRYPKVSKMILPLKTFVKSPRAIFRAYSAAMLHQLLFFTLFLQVSFILSPAIENWRLLAAVLPAGIITTAIPLAPGGMGVGHVAFDSIYRLLGSKSGADIFNIVAFSQLILNFLGLIPYMLNRSSYTNVEDIADQVETSRSIA